MEVRSQNLPTAFANYYFLVNSQLSICQLPLPTAYCQLPTFNLSVLYLRFSILTQYIQVSHLP
jgi:hypothetical protein